MIHDPTRPKSCLNCASLSIEEVPERREDSTRPAPCALACQYCGMVMVRVWDPGSDLHESWILLYGKTIEEYYDEVDGGRVIRLPLHE